MVQEDNSPHSNNKPNNGHTRCENPWAEIRTKANGKKMKDKIKEALSWRWWLFSWITCKYRPSNSDSNTYESLAHLATNETSNPSEDHKHTPKDTDSNYVNGTNSFNIVIIASESIKKHLESTFPTVPEEVKPLPNVRKNIFKANVIKRASLLTTAVEVYELTYRIDNDNLAVKINEVNSTLK